MSRNYDNWEKLVEAVLRQEKDREIAMCPSISSSSSSSFNLSFSSSSNSRFYDDHESLIISNRGQNFHTLVKERAYLNFLNQIFDLDERTKKKCYMVGAKDLSIAWGDNPSHWNRKFHPDSRFAEVTELKSIWWLDIRGKISTQMLSPETPYTARYEGLNYVGAIIIYVDKETDGDAEKRSRVVHLEPDAGKIFRKGRFATRRADGWTEIEIGKFNVGKGDVEARLLGTGVWKTDLIVEGIEFRPKYSETPFVQIST